MPISLKNTVGGEFVATSTVAGTFSTATTGVKLTITPVAGKKARLIGLVHKGDSMPMVKITRDGEVFCTESLLDPGTTAGVGFGFFMVGSNSGSLTSNNAAMSTTVAACVPHIECNTSIVIELTIASGSGSAGYRILYGE